jgi:hypothetical protein
MRIRIWRGCVSSTDGCSEDGSVVLHDIMGCVTGPSVTDSEASRMPL